MNSKCEFILVGGIGRSGTSILSRLIASSKGAEYFYEPPVFMHLLEKLDQIRNDLGLPELLETVLYNDLMKGALSGRALNLNRNDLSSVYHYKDNKSVEERFKESFRQEDLEQRMRNSFGVIKVLDSIHRFDRLQLLLPVFKAVIVLRNPIDSSRSILAKKWFSDEHLSPTSPSPFRLMNVIDNIRTPTFIRSDEFEKWRNSSELGRVLMYHQRHISEFYRIASNENVSFVTYESLVNNTRDAFIGLANKLTLSAGPKTEEILESIELKSTRDEDFSEIFYATDDGPSVMESYNKLLSYIK